MVGCRDGGAFICKKPVSVADTLILPPSNKTISTSIFCARVKHNPHLFLYLVCLSNLCINVPFLLFIYMWLLIRLNAMLQFLKTLQHLTMSYSFLDVPHILGIELCAIIWVKKKRKDKKTWCYHPGCCPFFDSVSSCIALVLSLEAGSASSLLLKPSTKPAHRLSRAHPTAGRGCSLTHYSILPV